MRRTTLHRAATACVLLLAVLFFSGCRVVDDNGTPSAPAVRGGYAIDSQFREFYLLLGGEQTLGAAISPLVEAGILKSQYTEKVLLRYDPSAEVSQQFSLAPIGLDLGYQDSSLPIPDQAGATVIEGYLLYDEFVPLYEALQGSRFAGQPLTQVRLNAAVPRIEQYFENAAFYRRLDEPPGQVHLLAYGAHKCGLACRPAQDRASDVVPLSGPPQPFLSGIARVGSDLFGAPLSAPYQTLDGQIEQVYESAVIAAPPDDIADIHLRPAAKLSGYPSQSPVARMDDARMVFYPVTDDLGYNIPAVFRDYIDRHGGMQLAGLPISELFPEGSLYRQCFENYCLDYDPAAQENTRIQPAPVGERYLQLFPAPEQAAPQPPEPIEPGITSLPILAVTEAYPLLPPGQAQELSIQVVEENSRAPVPNLSATISMVLPDGSTPTYSFVPTGPDGRSTLVLPLFSGKPGQLFLYQVCLQGGGPPACTSGSYLIWEK